MVTRSRPLASTTRASVSVVIPNYNYGRFLGDAATSALSQDDVDVNVIIIDNASTDNSRHVAVALAESDSRVKCIFRTSNQGFVANFNEGLSHATGEYVVLLCADDLLTPGSLGRSTRNSAPPYTRYAPSTTTSTTTSPTHTSRPAV